MRALPAGKTAVGGRRQEFDPEAQVEDFVRFVEPHLRGPRPRAAGAGERMAIEAGQ